MKLSGVVMTFGRSKSFPLCDNLLSLSSNLLKEHESQNVPASFALKSSKVALGLAALETDYVTCVRQLSDIILSGRIL